MCSPDKYIRLQADSAGELRTNWLEVILLNLTWLANQPYIGPIVSAKSWPAVGNLDVAMVTAGQDGTGSW